MNLPKVVADLIEAQNKYDSAAYANCFSETAVVFDEGNTYEGRAEIQNWIDNANKKFKTVRNPLKYETFETEDVLTAEISGNFEGSPVVLHYHFKIDDGQIQSLNVTI